MIDTASARYADGRYDVEFGDDTWKAAQVFRAVQHIPRGEGLTSYADVGCGSGGVFIAVRDHMVGNGFAIARAVGYDIIHPDKVSAANRQDVVFKGMEFGADDEEFDLVTINDVVEHVLRPQDLLAEVARRARYVVLHIPLDDRLSVTITNQFNYRLGPVGHISFWNQATALNLLTSSGLLPLWCALTPGFAAPSSKERLIQRIAFPFRWLLWRINPGLMAKTVGGASMVVLCRGGRA